MTTEPSLSLVAYDQDLAAEIEAAAEDTTPTATEPSIPKFEGEEVIATGAKMTVSNKLEIQDRVWRVDESVKMVVEARVVGIQHTMNPAGKLERVHVMKVLPESAFVIDWAMDLDALRDALSE